MSRGWFGLAFGPKDAGGGIAMRANGKNLLIQSSDLPKWLRLNARLRRARTHSHTLSNSWVDSTPPLPLPLPLSPSLAEQSF